MDFENSTPFPAGLFRTAIDDDRIAASLAARVTYDLADSGLTRSEEQTWQVSRDPWTSDYGLVDGDALFHREGVDVLLFGNVRPPRRDTTSMRVSVRVGEVFSRDVMVHGVRVWTRGLLSGRLVPTSPRPLTPIPLTSANAYGGRDVWEDLSVPYPLNPDGMGFYLSEAAAVDRPLPSMEEPDQLIKEWDDRPTPAGLAPYPPGHPLRLMGMVREVDDKPQLKFGARLFNTAHPRMIAREAKAGMTVSLEGMTSGRPIVFRLPDERLHVQVRFDDETHTEPLIIDQIGIEPEKRRVFISYRFPFRYSVRPGQLRACRLLA